MLDNPITWVYISFGLAGLVVILIVALVAGYLILKPVAIPYLKCRGKAKTPLMGIFQRNGRLRLVPGKYVAEMYEDPDPKNPLAFFKSDTGGYKIGACDLRSSTTAPSPPPLRTWWSPSRNSGAWDTGTSMT